MGTHKNIKKTIESITNLPSHPMAIEKITRLLSNPRTSVEEIGRAITTDQALASKVLKLVNSAFYGFPGRISTLSHAIVILGFSTIKNIVLTATIFESLKGKGGDSPEFDLHQFWYHSIACGAATSSLAKKISFGEKEECFIAGLIHDIGKIILCHYLPAEFAVVIEDSRSNERLFLESEQKLFDTTHDEIGGYLTKCWNLPDNLQHAVRFHHSPSPFQNHYMISALVHAADIFVRALDLGNGGDDKIPVISEQVWKSLDLDNTSLSSTFDMIREEVDKASVFFQLT